MNGDHQVDTTDVSAVTAGTSATLKALLDVNGDGVVNGLDLMFVARARGRELADGLILD